MRTICQVRSRTTPVAALSTLSGFGFRISSPKLKSSPRVSRARKRKMTSNSPQLSISISTASSSWSGSWSACCLFSHSECISLSIHREERALSLVSRRAGRHDAESQRPFIYNNVEPRLDAPWELDILVIVPQQPDASSCCRNCAVFVSLVMIVSDLLKDLIHDEI